MMLEVIKIFFGLILAPLLILPVYVYEVYVSLFRMTIHGESPKRYKTGYHDFGFVKYKQPVNKSKKFENQILGAILFIPCTVVLIVLLLFLIHLISDKVTSASSRS